MRLTAEQVRQGLSHDDLEVRQRCLDYFTGTLSLDDSIMPLVTEAIDVRGAKAFRFFHRIDQLAQTDATIEWIVRNLRQAPRFFDNLDTVDFRPAVLVEANVQLLSRHRDSILPLLQGTYHESALRRLQFLSESPAALWDRVEALCARDCLNRWNDYPRNEVSDLIAVLSDVDGVPIDRLMELLKTEIADDTKKGVLWLEAQLVELAGMIRWQPVLPIVIEKLRIDSDFLNETCQDTLIRLGSDDVVRTIAELLPQEEWFWQLFASCVFEHVHSDEVVRVGAGLLDDDRIENSIRQNVAHGMVCQFSTEGLDIVCRYLDEHDEWLDDTEWTETLSQIRAASTLMGVDVPRLTNWEAQMEEAFRTGRATLGGLRLGSRHEPEDDDFEEDEDTWEFEKEIPPETIVHETARVGRNDPCPCGSGKKFKKCCYGKVE